MNRNDQSENRHLVALVTGATGTLGSAIAQRLALDGFEVVGVTRRKAVAPPEGCKRLIVNSQESLADAEELAKQDADLVILAAGAIERDVTETLMPRPEQTDDVLGANYVFPARYILSLSERRRSKETEVILIGSIADAHASPFGPPYHSSKQAVSQFCIGLHPILKHSTPPIHLRLYRPGVIAGDFATAPLLRLNDVGADQRRRRMTNAPDGNEAAADIVAWRKTNAIVGGAPLPLFMRFFKGLQAFAPNKLEGVNRQLLSKYGRKVTR